MENFKPEKRIKSKNEYLAHYLNRLKQLFEEFSDEIPSEVKHSYDEDNKYKVRAAWWSSVSIVIYGLEKQQLIPDELAEEFNTIMSSHQEDLKEDGLTKADSIKAVNKLIKKIVKHLENI